MDRLRASTQVEHQALEDELSLLDPPPDRGRMRWVLERFYGFHRAWEPAVAAQLADEAFFGPRRRLGLLETDLIALGADKAGVAALPVCKAAAPADPAAAMGWLYVMEGSTLGGQVIDRALKDAPWAPPGGLRYFKPYGDQAGVFWRAFRARAEDLPAQGDDAVVAGARQAFATLQAWFEQGRGLAAPP